MWIPIARRQHVEDRPPPVCFLQPARDLKKEFIKKVIESMTLTMKMKRSSSIDRRWNIGCGV